MSGAGLIPVRLPMCESNLACGAAARHGAFHDEVTALNLSIINTKYQMKRVREAEGRLLGPVFQVAILEEGREAKPVEKRCDCNKTEYFAGVSQ